MSIYFERLLSVSGDSICAAEKIAPPSYFSDFPLFSELKNLLKNKNGFYAFESALHVLPINTHGNEVGLLEWNRSNKWIDYYEGIASNALYFAEDIFGGQFCIKKNGIYLFDPETGDFEYIAKNLGGWCKVILEDYEILTGYPLAHEWQSNNGPIETGHRLVPKIPFVAGGEFNIDNIYSEKSDVSMRSRADFALQIRNLPDGSKIQFKIIE